MPPHSDLWFKAREGRLTGSRLGVFCGAKGIGDGGMTYIRRKVAEKLAGKCFEVPLDNFSTEWGRVNEPIGLNEFKTYMESCLKQDIIMIQPSVIEYDDLYSCTPDACIITNTKLITDSDDTGYFVEPVELKCLQVDSHMDLLRCNNALDLKKSYPLYFWQTISETQFCGSLKGHFAAFNPDFTEGLRIHHIEFRKALLIEEFKLFNSRLEEARKIYHEELSYYQSLNTKYNERTVNPAA